jgi:hypothetical protein
MFVSLFGILGAALIMYGAVTQFTTLAALTQMGSIQERVAPWANFSKPKLRSSPKPGDDGQSDEKGRCTDVLHHVRSKDKIIYTFSVVNSLITAYIFGAFPQYFYLWHTPKAIIYIAHRWITFRKQNQHYLLYDFCYWANGLSLLYCWVFPQSPLLFQILFVVSNGPLAWSVLAFSQSLIFHSAPHMASVFIHTSPMLLTFTVRWNGTLFAVAEGDPMEIPFFELTRQAITCFYAWWVVLYYVWVFIIMAPRIRARGYKTLFDRVISRGPTKFIARISNLDLIQKAAYMLTHVVFAVFTMLLTEVYWRSYGAHFFFVVAIFITSAWNASGFYFTVFLTHYEQELYDRAGIPQSPPGESAR